MYIICAQDKAVEMYSASQVNRDTQLYFLLNQETKGWLIQ